MRFEESLTIRTEDESRIVSAMADASKKKTSGAFYSISVPLLSNGKMGIGVKDLSNNILAVSMLKRPNGENPNPLGVSYQIFKFHNLDISMASL